MDNQEPDKGFFDLEPSGDRVVSPSQIREAQLQAPKSTASRSFELDDFKRITDKVWVGNNAYALASREQFDVDPTYVMDNVTLKGYVEQGLPPEYLSILSEANSKEEEEYLFGVAKAQWEDTQKINELGGYGTAATLGLAVLDPAFIATGVAATAIAGPAGTAGVAGVKAKRLVSALKSAGATAVLDAPLQSVIAANQADVDSMDAFAMTMLGSTLVGGVTYGLGGKAARLSAMAEHTADLAIVRQSFDKGLISEADYTQTVESITNKIDKLKKQTGSLVERIKEFIAPEGGVFGQNLRIDISAQINRSKEAIVNKYRGLVTEPVGRSDAGTVNASAEEYKQIFFNRHMGGFVDSFDRAFNKIMEPLIKGEGKTQTVINKLGRVVDVRGESVKMKEHIARAVRRPAGQYTATLNVSDDIKRAIDEVAEVTRKEFSDIIEELKAAGVKGLDDIDLRNSFYVPRVYNANVIQNLLRDGVDLEDLEQLMIKAIRSGTSKEKMTDERVAQIARGMVQGIIQQGERAYQKSGKLTANMSEEFTDRIKNAVADITDEELEGIIAGFVRKDSTPAQGVLGAAKKRVSIDETVGIVTKGGRQLQFEDLLENNIQNLLEQYIHRMGGSFGMARQGFDPEEILKDIQQLVSEGKKKEANLLQAVYNKLMGFSTEGQQAVRVDNATLLTGVRRFTSAAQLTFMNQVALAQIPEFAGVLGVQVFRANVKNIPAFRSMLKAATEGRLDESTMRVLNRFTGLGTSHTRFAPSSAFDNAGVMEAGKFTKIDELLNKSVHGMYSANGMHLVTAFQRQLSAAIEIDRLLQLINKGWDDLSELEVRRLTAQGVSKSDWPKIRAVMRSPKYIKTKTGNYGDAFEDIDFEAMFAKNPEMAEKISIMIKRAVDKTVVVDDIGSLPVFADGALGRFFMQFRKFTMMSYPKLFLGMLYRKDYMDAAVSTSLGMTIASLVYLGQVHMNAIGKGEGKQDYLDDRLGFDEGFSKFILTTAGRTSQLAAPMQIMDTAVSLATGDPLLGSGRYMGLSPDFLNPAKTPAGTVAGTLATAPLQLVVGGVTFNQELVGKSLGDISDVAPFARLPIINNMINGLKEFASEE